MKKSLLLLFVPLFAIAQTETQPPKTYTITRTQEAPKINGVSDDAVWNNAGSITDFVQFEPIQDAIPTQKTEVKLLYDNTAIYVSAIMYDTQPDSVLRLLGLRDNAGIADRFTIAFDTYNKAQDAYFFTVSASGVQLDERMSDPLYNTVWESAVKMRSDGWCVEMKIPYSALRFPTSDVQEWGMHIQRVISRNNERIRWTSTSKSDANFMTKWGKLQGLTGIEAPLRLSVTPYITTAVSKDGNQVPGSQVSSSVSGGMGLRYGINESFTLDATLLPDFSQVRSDDVVKNLSAFEVTYDEQRPFFLEGTDLFSKGDIFYSRRIGRTPGGFYSVSDQLNPGERIIKNPSQAKMLNALKLSGRTNKGLGLGILNAVLDNTYAVAEDEQGNRRKILTEPFSNYNMLVADQQLKNGSSFYISNGNVMRNGEYSDANTAAAGFSLNNKKNTYRVSGDGAIANTFYHGEANSGFRYSSGLEKTSGKLKAGLYHSAVSANYDNNAIGITQESGLFQTGLWIYHDQYEPHGKLLNTQNYINTYASHSTRDGKLNSIFLHSWKMIQFHSYNSFWAGIITRPVGSRDFYEARTDGRIFKRKPGGECFLGAQTDSRKKFTFYTEATYGRQYTQLYDNSLAQWGRCRVNPKMRFNNRLTCEADINIGVDHNDMGYFTTEGNGDIIFGRRDVNTFSGLLYAGYVIRNNLSLGVRARQYWASGNYKVFYLLGEDGSVGPCGNHYADPDFTYNSFTIDSTLEWQFAPGSTMSLVWKDAILNEENQAIGLWPNFRNSFSRPQQQTVSLRLLYYFDAQYLKSKSKNADS